MTRKGTKNFIIIIFLMVTLLLTAFSQQCKTEYPPYLYGRLLDIQGNGLPQYNIEIYYLDFIKTTAFFGALEKLFMKGMSDDYGWFELCLENAGERYPENFLSKVYIRKDIQEFYKYLNVNADDFPPVSGIQEMTLNSEDRGSLFESEWVAVNRAINDPENYLRKSLTKTEKDFVKVEIKSNPKGAFVEINDVFIGTSDINIFLEKDIQYTIQLYKGNQSKTFSVDTTNEEIQADGIIQIQWDIE